MEIIMDHTRYFRLYSVQQRVTAILPVGGVVCAQADVVLVTRRN